MNEGNPAPDLLLAQARWIRGLALRLARDPVEAEDALQETWLAALKRPPRAEDASPARARGWLARVLANVLRQEARSEGARTKREHSRARSEALPDSTELLGQVDAQRVVVEELLALKEPYRRVLLLRYFRDHSAAAIAHDTGLSAATVRSHQKRALALLRERMDARYDGDGHAWRAVFLAPSFVPTTSPASAGASTAALTELRTWIAMNTLTKVALVAGLVAAGVGYRYFDGSRRTEATASTPRDALTPLARPEDTARAKTIEPVEAPAAVEERAAVATREREPEPDAVAEPAVEAKPAFAAAGVTATFVDESTNPVRGVRTYLLKEGAQAWREDARAETSDFEGRVVLELAMDEEGKKRQLVYEADGFVSGIVPAQLRAGETQSLGTIVLAPAARIAGTVFHRGGRPLAGASVWFDTKALPDFPEGHLRRRGMGEFFAPPTTPLAVTTDENGRYLLEGLPRAQGRVWAHAEDFRYSYTDELSTDQRPWTDVDLELEPLGVADRIACTVLLPDGSPYANQSVQYGFNDTGWSLSSSLMTDGDGRLDLVVWREAAHAFTIKGKYEQWATHRVEDVMPGADFVIQLRAPVSLELAVRDPDGVSLPAYSFDIQVGTKSRSNQRIEAIPLEGVFRFDRPEAEFVLTVRAPGFTEEELGPFTKEKSGRIECTLFPVPTVSGIVLADGQPVAGAKIGLYSVVGDNMRLMVNGFPCLMHSNARERGMGKSDADGMFEIGLRQSDEYYVIVEADGLAPAVLGPWSIHVDTGLADLEVHLKEGATLEVRVSLPDGADPAGRIVGITDGRPDARTKRVDEDGVARFHGLTLGRYLVRLVDKEIRTNYTTSSSYDVDPPSRFELPWVVEVGPGTTTYTLVVDEE